MKIWIDITSPPHVNFFRPFIKELEDDVIVTARDFGTIRESLDRLDIEYKAVGFHGRSKEGRLIKSVERIKKLTKIIKDEKPDVGLSKHSVELPRVCFGLGIPSITVLDHDTADIQNRLIIPFSDIMVTPTFVSKAWMKKFGAREIMQFYGVSEYVNYIDFKPSKDVLDKLGLSKGPVAISRSEPFLSSHVYHKSNLFGILKDVLNEVKNLQVVFLTRNKTDKKEFSELDLVIPRREIDVLSLYKYADLMIGAGCCMNREACLAGCPTISIYPDDLPAVDRFLIRRGLMKHTLSKREAVKWCLESINNGKKERKRIERIVKKFENPYDTIRMAINKLVVS